MSGVCFLRVLRRRQGMDGPSQNSRPLGIIQHYYLPLVHRRTTPSSREGLWYGRGIYSATAASLAAIRQILGKTLDVLLHRCANLASNNCM